MNKNSLWTGFLIAFLVQVMIFVFSFFIPFIPYIPFYALFPFAIIGSIVWGLVELFKFQNKKFGLGLILGALFPLLIFGACVSIITLNIGY